jgi:hypothetical protein
MSIIARAPKTDYATAPEGLHPAVCIDVVDLGMVTSEYGVKHKVQIRWALDDEDDTGRRFIVSRRFTLSLHKKAALTQTLQMWRNKKFTEAELEGFDLEKLLGAPCQVQVVHNARNDGQVFADVQAVIPLGRGVVKPTIPPDYVRMQDREGSRPTTAHDSEADAALDDDPVPF